LEISRNLGRKVLIVLGVIVVLWLTYFYPVQRFLALRNFEQYIELQGAPKSDIQETEIFKDYKQDGYCMNVIYKSDPDFVYRYKFSVFDKSKLFSYGSIRCVVYNEHRETTDLHGEIVKYPPLDEQI
jgi:hypothetical protein